MQPARHHYAALDGLRGVLALGVLLYHFGHWFQYLRFFPSFNLAVDVFFCLSGFVLSFAYEGRQGGISLGRFTISRLIRLVPIMALATFVSAAFLILKNHVAPVSVGPGIVGVAVVLGLLNLPFFSAPHDIGGPQVFPLNGPQYTLSLEIFVNILWWAVRRYDTRIVNTVFIVGSLPFLLLYGAGGDETVTYWTGFPRVIFSFFAGCAVYQLGKKTNFSSNSLSLYVLVVGLAALVLSWPMGLGPAFKMVWIIFFSPALVLLCSRIRLGPKAAPVALMAGELSYPVYAMHYPIFCFENGFLQALTHSRNALLEGTVFAVSVPLVCFFAMRFYDTPVRRFLNRTFLPRQETSTRNRKGVEMASGMR